MIRYIRFEVRSGLKVLIVTAVSVVDPDPIRIIVPDPYPEPADPGPGSDLACLI
jgi:hypothetical protein